MSRQDDIAGDFGRALARDEPLWKRLVSVLLLFLVHAARTAWPMAWWSVLIGLWIGVGFSMLHKVGVAPRELSFVEACAGGLWCFLAAIWRDQLTASLRRNGFLDGEERGV